MKVPVLTNPAPAIEAAIRDPIGAAPLWEIVSPGQTVVFIVNDPTHAVPSHVFLPVLIDEIHAVGVPYEDMSIVFVIGGNRPLTEPEMVEAVGAQVASQVKMFNSGGDFFTDTRVTAAKHTILTGSVEALALTSNDHERMERREIRRPSFLLTVVMNAEKQCLKVFAGNYVLAHREACAFADEIRFE